MPRSSETALSPEIDLPGSRPLADFAWPIPVAVTRTEDRHVAAPRSLSGSPKQLRHSRISSRPAPTCIPGASGGANPSTRRGPERDAQILPAVHHLVAGTNTTLPGLSRHRRYLAAQAEFTTCGASAACGLNAVTSEVEFIPGETPTGSLVRARNGVACETNDLARHVAFPAGKGLHAHPMRRVNLLALLASGTPVYSRSVGKAIARLAPPAMIDPCGEELHPGGEQIHFLRRHARQTLRPDRLPIKTCGLDLATHHTNTVGVNDLRLSGVPAYLGAFEAALPGAATIDSAGEIGPNAPQRRRRLPCACNYAWFEPHLSERYVGAGRALPRCLAAPSGNLSGPAHLTGRPARSDVTSLVGKHLFFPAAREVLASSTPIASTAPYRGSDGIMSSRQDVIGWYAAADFQVRL